MFELVVIFCIIGSETECSSVRVDTPDCVSTFAYINETKDPRVEVRGLGCVRLPPRVYEDKDGLWIEPKDKQQT